MNLDSFKKIKPLKTILAFVWIKPKLESGILLPETFYDLKLQIGKFYIGKVVAVGPKVIDIKLNDNILVHEYGIKNWKGSWKENEVYFIEEGNCKAVVKDLKGLINRPVDKTLDKHL